MPSLSESVWSEFGIVGQLSQASPLTSPRMNLDGGSVLKLALLLIIFVKLVLRLETTGISLSTWSALGTNGQLS